MLIGMHLFRVYGVFQSGCIHKSPHNWANEELFIHSEGGAFLIAPELFEGSEINCCGSPHLRTSLAAASLAAAASASAAAASAATSAAATAAAAALFRVASNLWMADTSAAGPLPEGETFHRMLQSDTEVGSFALCGQGNKGKLWQTQQVLPKALRVLTPPLFCLDRCSLWHTEHMPLVLGLP